MLLYHVKISERGLRKLIIIYKKYFRLWFYFVMYEAPFSRYWTHYLILKIKEKLVIAKKTAWIKRMEIKFAIYRKKVLFTSRISIKFEKLVLQDLIFFRSIDIWFQVCVRTEHQSRFTNTFGIKRIIKINL